MVTVWARTSITPGISPIRRTICSISPALGARPSNRTHDPVDDGCGETGGEFGECGLHGELDFVVRSVHQAQDVALGDDADEAAIVVDHRQTLDGQGDHPCCWLADGVGRSDGVGRDRHHVTGNQAARLLAPPVVVGVVSRDHDTPVPSRAGAPGLGDAGVTGPGRRQRRFRDSSFGRGPGGC
jgi:hypothetical protein